MKIEYQLLNLVSHNSRRKLYVMFAIGCYIKKSVKQCNLDKYPCQKYFNRRKSYDNKEYICKTCHSKVIKGKIPCQAVINDMYIDEIPQELASLAKLEQILVSKRIVFQKISHVKRPTEKN